MKLNGVLILSLSSSIVRSTSRVDRASAGVLPVLCVPRPIGTERNLTSESIDERSPRKIILAELLDHAVTTRGETVVSAWISDRFAYFVENGARENRRETLLVSSVRDDKLDARGDTVCPYTE